MKKLILSLLAAVLLIPATLSAAAFEGTITTKMTTPEMKPTDQPVVITYSIKEGYYRMDPQITATDKKGTTTSMSVAFIMDLKNQQMLIMMPQQKMYMVRAIPQPDANVNSTPGANPDTPKKEVTGTSDYTVERTGQKESILGYSAEKYVIKSKSKDGTTEIWATDQLGSYMSAGAGGNPMGGRGRSSSSSAPPQAWESVLNGKGFFPLRIVALDKNGKETMRTETTAIDKKSLSAADFAPPADYQKFDVGNMMKGMIPGGFGK
jgi:hypothetical protein